MTQRILFTRYARASPSISECFVQSYRNIQGSSRRSAFSSSAHTAETSSLNYCAHVEGFGAKMQSSGCRTNTVHDEGEAAQKTAEILKKTPRRRGCETIYGERLLAAASLQRMPSLSLVRGTSWESPICNSSACTISIRGVCFISSHHVAVSLFSLGTTNIP